MRRAVVIAVALGGLALTQEPVVRITEQVTWVRDADGAAWSEQLSAETRPNLACM
jgi:hypothetical protein